VRQYRLSRAAYRLLLRVYPGEFRDRFGGDLEADFLEMRRTRGALYAWRRTLGDLLYALPRTTSDAAAERARVARVGGPITRPGESAMRSLLFDLRHGLRALVKAPGFTVVTILTLALGIGANSAIFTLVNAALVRPLGFADPDRLMLVYEAIPGSGRDRFGVSPADYGDLLESQRSFAALGAYRTATVELSGGGEPEQVDAAAISPPLFDVLAVKAADGRTFLADEDPSSAIISHGLAMRHFAGRPAVGATIAIDRRPFTVVGVMPAEFEFPRRGASSNATPADVWMPLVLTPAERQARGANYNLGVIGRLRDRTTPAQAVGDLSTLAVRIRDNYPAALPLKVQVGAIPLAQELLGEVRRPLLILFGAVALVLLVTCANVANLVLSRSLARQRDIGVRAALGAGRLRLFQILLGEALILSLAGAALGLVLGYWALRAIPAVLRTSLPGISTLPLDWRVVAFTGVVALGSAALFALLPLAAGLRRDLHDLLREGSTRTTGGRRQQYVQATLVVTSVAFAFILLVCAGLFVRSFRTLVTAPSGLGATNVLSAQVRLPLAGYTDPARTRAFFRALDERLRALPGVRAASMASDLPLDPDGDRRAWTPENPTGPGLQQAVAVTWVQGDFFGSYGIPLLSGRPFSGDDERDGRNVAIVNKRLADAYWPGGHATGKRLKWGLNAASPAPWLTIVGVAGDVVDGPPGSEPVIHVYVPYSSVSDALLTSRVVEVGRRVVIGIRGDQEAMTFAPALRAVVADLDPALPVSDLRTIEDLERTRSAPQRFSAVAISGFGVGALLLAAIGLYGVLAFSVSQRRREIAVRLALGATPREVLRTTVLEGMTLVAMGLAAGAAGAASATRLLRAALFETSVYDPLTFALVPIVLVSVALAASYGPARRAAAVDPIVALRD
jgi:putative ABC transport system permease protein